jgi:anthranilate phosphoribosyltransferase
VLEAIREATRSAIAPVDEVVDIADPYDGFNRTLPASPFLPPVLAACGLAVVTHGVRIMGPKYGVTHRQVLDAAGVRVDLGPEEAAARVGDSLIGWAYTDQEAFCPKLHDLATLRTLIVKRPALTTVEVLAGPVRGRGKTHLVTGYVHKPYPRIYALLARHAGFDSALIVRGVEGGVIPSLAQNGRVFRYQGAGEESATDFKPVDLGIVQSVRAPRLPGASEESPEETPLDAAAAAQAAAAAGTAALAGEPGATRDCLVYGAALCLWHLGRHGDLASAAAAARSALDSGRALRHLHQAI